MLINGEYLIKVFFVEGKKFGFVRKMGILLDVYDKN